MINPNWARWVWASCTKFMDDNKGPYFLFIEGTTRQTAQKDAFLEFRMDGPNIREPSHNYFVADVTINIMIQSTMDGYDAHKFQRAFGWAQSMFRGCIPVYKFGNGPQDDPNVLLGYLVLKNSLRVDSVKSLQLGQVDPILKMMQATVEAKYQMDFVGTPNTISVSLTDDVVLGDNSEATVN